MKKSIFFSVFIFLVTTILGQSDGDYRSVVSGDWNNSSTWERFNGSIWVVAVTTPADTDGIITIKNLNDITVNTAVSIDQLIIDAGGSLSIFNTLTVSDATGTDLICNGTLTLTSTMAGTGTSLVNGTMNWTLGTLSNPVTISASGVLNLGTTPAKALNNTLTNNGVINWNAGNINFNTATLNNNGVIINSFDGAFENFIGVNSFTNSGVFTKSGGSGNTIINIPYTNAGTLNVNNGTVTNTNTMYLNSGTLFNGTGILTLNGTVNVNAPVTTPANLIVNISTGSTLGTEIFTVNGTMNWSGGTLGSPFTISSGGVLTAFSSTKTLNSILNNYGTMNWTAGDFNFNNGTFNNNGVINNSFNGLFSNSGGTNLLYNSGVFNKTAGASNTIIQVSLNNTGNINVNSGTFFKNGSSFTNGGTISISSGCNFQNTTTLNLNSGTSFNGSGTIILDGTVNVNVAINIPGTLLINKPGGSTTAGSGVMTINGIMNWTGGTIASPFTISSSGILNLSSATRALNTSLTNAGLINWSAGNINFNNGSLVNNGIIVNSFNGNLSNNGGSNSFNNTGTFNKSGGLGITLIGIPAINTGSFTGQGTIHFSSTLSNNGSITPGAPIAVLTLTSSSAAFLSSASTLNIDLLDNSGAGSGHDQLAGNNNLILNGTLTVTEISAMPNGTYTIINLTAGSITGSFTNINLPPGYSISAGINFINVIKTLLPVTWISFTGKWINKKVQLRWKTANEKNNSHFEIERSENAVNFYRVGRMDGAKNSSSDNEYNFYDETTVKEIYYYRLRQVDEDGKFNLSGVIKVKADGGIQSGVKIFPNPAHNNIYIDLSDEWLNSVIYIINALGQPVMSRTTLMQQLTPIHLTPGNYWIFIIKDKLTITQKLIIN